MALPAVPVRASKIIYISILALLMEFRFIEK